MNDRSTILYEITVILPAASVTGEIGAENSESLKLPEVRRIEQLLEYDLG
jgi:hypothetical protein